MLSGIPEGDNDRPRLLVLLPDITDVLELASTLRPLPGFEPILPVTGLARAGRLLAAGAGRTILTTPRDAIRLAETSRLKLDRPPAIVLAWPELLDAGDTAVLDTVLAEAAEAQRIVLTSTPAAIKDLLERHARRAPVSTAAVVPEQPTVPARFMVVEGVERLAPAIRAVLDSLNPAATLLWEPTADRFERWSEFGEDPSVVIADVPPEDRTFDVAIAARLPSAEVLARLRERAQDVIVLLRAAQIPYLQRIARPLRNLRVADAADRARERSQELRRALRRRIEDEDVSAELLALAPLFDEYDPAVVAAALAREARRPAAGAAAAAAEEPAGLTAWVRIQVTVGKRDKIRPADLVGALLNGVGLAKDHVGRIDIREGFSIIEIRADDAPRALRGLAGIVIRGKTLGARVAN